ncbi:hypothetical protein ACO0LO_18790 [Undibacterium sp. TJN25]|uniref:hypothetical protein n=1 Tax=Undibacterium sp. TJN25 TaxID=3413056 RepID=UPI003BF0FB45
MPGQKGSRLFRPAVLEKLRATGIDYAQGYLTHRPAPIEELLSLGAADRETEDMRHCA